jgi:hypothetical protein
MKLTQEQAQELAWGGAVEGLEYVAEVGMGARRWSETIRVVFVEVGKPELWAFEYEKGLTENQETEIEAAVAFRVEAVPVTTTTYKRLAAKS